MFLFAGWKVGLVRATGMSAKVEFSGLIQDQRRDVSFYFNFIITRKAVLNFFSFSCNEYCEFDYLVPIFYFLRVCCISLNYDATDKG